MLKYYCSNPEQHPIPKAEVDNGQDSYFSTSAKD